MTLLVQIKAQLGAFHLDVDFTAPKGVTVLFGPSGCGKSSIIGAVAGLIRPASGQIMCNDDRLFDSAAGVNLPPHRRRLGVVFQQPRLLPHLNVRQNLLFGRWFAPTRLYAPSQPAANLSDITDLLGIGPLLHRRPATLSGGEAARVALGRALLSAPAMILADEPLAALDEARRAEILPYFAALRDAALVPMIYVTHALSEVAQLATTVISLQGGRVVAMGRADDVLGRADVMGAAAVSLLPARLICHHPDGLSELETPAGRVFVPRMSADLGAQLQLRIAAQDVILARSAPSGISALNILQGQIAQIAQLGGGAVMVTLQAGESQLRARITGRSCMAMGLSVGDQVTAIVKSLAMADKT